MKQKIFISTFVVLISISISIFLIKTYSRNLPVIDRSEEPFSYLNQPFRSVHAVHILDGGVGSVALRIVDANGRREILVALRDSSGKNRSKIARNAFVSWDEKIGFHNIETPSSYEEIPENVTVLNNEISALNNMCKILAFYHHKSGGATTIAYRAMTNPNYVSQ